MNYLLWVVLPNFNALSSFFGVIGAFVWTILYSIKYIDSKINDEELSSDTHKIFKKVGIFLGILLTLGCLTPGKEQVKSLVLIDTISHVKNIKELPDNTIELLNMFIKNQITKIGDNHDRL